MALLSHAWCSGVLGLVALGACRHRALSFASGAQGRSPVAVSKTVKSAVVVMPPVSVWDPIQKIRRFNDKGFYRWMPHINLLYPFLEDDGFNSFTTAAGQMAAALANLEPFRLQLARFRSFEHGRRSSTVWLEPEFTAGIKSRLRRGTANGASSPSTPDLSVVRSRADKREPLLLLQELLERTFPSCTDLSNDPKRGITAFTPHLSVGGWRGSSESEEAIKEMTTTWSPLEFTVNSVYLISRTRKSDSFMVRYEVPLGSHVSSAKEVNLKYACLPAGVEREDEWKYEQERPANGQHIYVDMNGDAWGLFQY